MSNQKIFNALIIGAGNIGCTYDKPSSEAVLTHAHAYSRHKRMKLKGIVDIDANRATKASKVWSCPSYTNIIDAVEQARPDMISVCVPDGAHEEVLRVIAKTKHRPRLVICEKPLTTTPTHSKAILSLFKKYHIPLLVDHTRRFDQTVVETKLAYDRGEYGASISAWATYSKGILHSGTHIIDLARYFFGEIKKQKTVFQRDDFGHKIDRTVGAFLSFERCPQFYLIAGNVSAYEYFQFDIVCEKARVSFFDLGFRYSVQKITRDTHYGCKVLGDPVIRDTQFAKAMTSLIQNAVDVLDQKAEMRCSGEDAYITQQVCWDLLNTSSKKTH
jgi:predicted dehydrogenase